MRGAGFWWVASPSYDVWPQDVHGTMEQLGWLSSQSNVDINVTLITIVPKTACETVSCISAHRCSKSASTQLPKVLSFWFDSRTNM